MNNTRTIVILLLAALIAAAFWGAIRYFMSFEKEQRTPSFPTRQDQTAATIHITAQGFDPRNMEITKEESVLFINDDVSAHWPASDVHPLHTTCPGFDALRGLKTGEQYRIAFTKSQTCPFHDHLDPSLAGSIVIK